nr:unnamed protein product [Callosobruchus analis]
MTSSDI